MVMGKFQKDLIVWKPAGLKTAKDRNAWFQKDLIVWKQNQSPGSNGGIVGVSEGLNSVETWV